MFVIFENSFNGNVVITTPEKRDQVINEFFTNGGRDIEDYDEYKMNEIGISISSRIEIR